MNKSKYNESKKIVAASVIIPTFNDRVHVSKAIKSVLHSSKLKIEIIVIDDGSKDGTCDFLKKSFGEKIKLIIHEKNQGLGASRNTGISHAVGNYIMFLDSDDWLDPGCIDEMYHLAKKSKADITAFGVRKVWNNGRTEQYHAHKFSSKGGIEALNNFTEYSIGSIVTNKLFLKSFINKIGLKFTPRYYHEDVMFTLKSLYYCNIYHSIPKVYYNYYQRKLSIINKKQTRVHLRSYMKLFIEMNEFINLHSLNSNQELSEISAKLIDSHCRQELVPKIIKYRKSRTFEQWSEDLRNVCKLEFPKNPELAISIMHYISQSKYLSNVFSDLKLKTAQLKLQVTTKELLEANRKLDQIYNLKSWKFIKKMQQLKESFYP